MTLEQLRAKAQETAQAIEDQGYYTERWAKACEGQPLIEEAKDHEALLARFQRMWELLPDSRDIRRAPFFAICDLAEEYCFGDWRDEP